MEYTLQNFLDTLKNVLEDVNNSQNILFRKSFREYFPKTWNEAQERIAQVKKDLKQADSKKLREVGLNEDESPAKLKLLGFFEAYDEYDSKAGIKRLKKVLKYAKIILSSLSKVIPGAEFLKEFIEAIEMGIEEAEKNLK